VSVEAIARRAGTSKATFYRYFAGKRDLVSALTAEGVPVPEGGGDTRERILEAALRLFPRYGLHGTSMDRLAREAGVSTATIYWHFKAKEDLIAAVIERFSVMPELRRLADLGASGDPERDLRELGHRIIDVLGTRLDMILVLLTEQARMPAGSTTPLREPVMHMWSFLMRYLEIQGQHGMLRPGLHPLLVMQAFVGPFFVYTIARRIFGPDAVPLSDKAVEAFVDIFLHGTARGALSREDRLQTPLPRTQRGSMGGDTGALADTGGNEHG
jgi:AcrR family transcriptional regulator